MKNPDILAATKPVAEAFEKLGILYYIGGSVASSTYGIPRSTSRSSLPLIRRVKSFYLFGIHGILYLFFSFSPRSGFVQRVSPVRIARACNIFKEVGGSPVPLASAVNMALGINDDKNRRKIPAYNR